MALWTAEVFVDSNVGTIHPTVEAGTHHGARQQIERMYGPVTQIVNLRQVNTRGGGESGGGSGCLGLLVVLGIIAAAIGGGGTGEKQNRPATPPESLSQPQSRVAEPYTPPAPEPMFQDYPTPPPSYCVTENFEPC